ncbi:ATP synthase F0 subunit B [Haliangium sp.]|uniref:ATP synthase F0 subunit B n=1 Tax=Haliangium sp. TaxID=2663208 RepID=UPI003D0A6C20
MSHFSTGGATAAVARTLLATVALALVFGVASAAQAAPSGGHGAGHGEGHGDPSAHFNWTDIGYGDKNVMGEPIEEGGEPMSPPFLLLIVNFAIVVGILWWKARPPILRFVQGRHEGIKDAIEEADRLRAEARKKLDELNERLEEAEKEIAGMKDDIRKSAEAEKKRILADAEAQAEAVKADADKRIEAEISRARTILEREVVAAAVAAAESLIRDKATGDDMIRLTESFIGDVEKQADEAATARS